MDKVKVFFYGTLKRGGRWNSYYIQNNEGYLDDDSINGKMFVYDGKDDRFGYPIATEGQGTINGEVWNIKRGLFRSISEMEQGAGYHEVEVFTHKGVKVKVFLIDMAVERNELVYKDFTKQVDTF